jgi:hypothetical protein
MCDPDRQTRLEEFFNSRPTILLGSASKGRRGRYEAHKLLLAVLEILCFTRGIREFLVEVFLGTQIS